MDKIFTLPRTTNKYHNFVGSFKICDLHDEAFKGKLIPFFFKALPYCIYRRFLSEMDFFIDQSYLVFKAKHLRYLDKKEKIRQAKIKKHVEEWMQGKQTSLNL